MSRTWAYRACSLVAVGLALAAFLPVAVRVTLLVGAIMLSLIDSAVAFLPEQRFPLYEIEVPETVEQLEEPEPEVEPPPFEDQTIVTVIPPQPNNPPTLGDGAFSSPRMRV